MFTFRIRNPRYFSFSFTIEHGIYIGTTLASEANCLIALILEHITWT